MGERIRFLKVIEGLLAPAPKTGRAAVLLLPASTGAADGFAGEPAEMSNGPELLFCLGAAGHISSLLRPGVSGVKTNQSATNKSTRPRLFAGLD